MASNPKYYDTLATPSITVSAANAAVDGTGTMVELMTGAALGSGIDDLIITARITTTVGMIRFFKDIAGTKTLMFEVPVTAVTRSASVPGWSQSLYNLGWRLESGQKIFVSTEKAEAFTVAVTRGGNFTT